MSDSATHIAHRAHPDPARSEPGGILDSRWRDSPQKGGGEDPAQIDGTALRVRCREQTWDVTGDACLEAGDSALAAGRWEEARAAFGTALEQGETGHAHQGLATALWWLGDNEGSVAEATKAYSLFRRSGEVEAAVQCALWLGIAYKANFANSAAANGWIARADRLLEPLQQGPLHGFAWVVRAYRMSDLDGAEALTRRALTLARETGDVDLELGALSQLGLILVGQGETAAGFALIDEAMAAVLGGERSSLDTVVYTCCDMLVACEVANDVERAAQWCRAADDFVKAYGCPFLHGECRICYGSVLAVKGRWAEAERELDVGLRLTEDACPALHDRALSRLADLRVRQGRLEDAAHLLAQVSRTVEAESEAAVANAALLLARGDAPSASHLLAMRLRNVEEHRIRLCGALDVYVDALLVAGDVDAAVAAAERLSHAASVTSSEHLAALADRARGRLALAQGDDRAAVTHLEAALRTWSRLEVPFDAARTRFDLARALITVLPDLAIEHGRRALETFDELGASAEADRVAAFLRAHGVVGRVGPKRAGMLTLREQEVLRLLAAGLSNPEIAERLHISRKTAAHHVSSVLAKLNLRNRTEAAAHAATALARQSLPPG
jgi:ATP/maltotriose-dependent transcriptional regulator MalT